MAEQVVLNAPDGSWSIEGVTVYENTGNSSIELAEVSRVLKFTPESQSVELVLKGLPQKLLPNSVRAELVGSTSAKIVELSTDDSFIYRKDTEQEAELKELNNGIKDINSEQRRIANRRVWLHAYWNSIIPQPTRAIDPLDLTNPTPINVKLMDQSTLEKVESTLEFVTTELSDLDTRERKATDERVRIQEELNKVDPSI